MLNRQNLLLIIIVGLVYANSAPAQESGTFTLKRTAHDIHPADSYQFEWPKLATLDVAGINDVARERLFAENRKLRESELQLMHMTISYQPKSYPLISVYFVDATGLVEGDLIHSHLPNYTVRLPPTGSQWDGEIERYEGTFDSTVNILRITDLDSVGTVYDDFSENRLGTNCSGLDRVKLAELWSIIRDEPFEPSLVSSFDVLKTDTKLGLWVYVIPTELVSLLADLKEPEISKISHAWMETDEYRRVNWPVERVHELLVNLRILATVARSREFVMVLKNSV